MRGLSDLKDGFSLLEVLVALVIVSLVVTGLSGLVTGLTRADRALQRLVVAEEEIQTTTRVVGVLFERSVPPSETSAFVGSAGAMAFETMGLPLLQATAPIRFRLDVRQAGGGADLYALWDGPTDGKAHEERLIRGAERLSFRYFGARSPKAGGTWGPAWQSRTILPDAVELTVDLGALGGPVELVFRTLARYPDICFADPTLSRCGTRR